MSREKTPDAVKAMIPLLEEKTKWTKGKGFTSHLTTKERLEIPTRDGIHGNIIILLPDQNELAFKADSALPLPSLPPRKPKPPKPVDILFDCGVISDDAPPRKYTKTGKVVGIAGMVAMIKIYSAEEIIQTRKARRKVKNPRPKGWTKTLQGWTRS